MMRSMKKITARVVEVVNQRVQVALPTTMMIKKKTMARAAEAEQNNRAVCTNMQKAGGQVRLPAFFVY